MDRHWKCGSTLQGVPCDKAQQHSGQHESKSGYKWGDPNDPGSGVDIRCGSVQRRTVSNGSGGSHMQAFRCTKDFDHDGDHSCGKHQWHNSRANQCGYTRWWSSGLISRCTNKPGHEGNHYQRGLEWEQIEVIARKRTGT